MKKKLVGIFIVTLLLVATGLTVAGTMKLNTNSPNGGEGAAGWGWYDPEGAWKRDDNQLFATFTRIGWGKYSIVCEGKTIVPTWYGMFPTAVDISLMYGEMHVTDWNAYDFTLIDYAIDENYEIVYFRLWYGVITFTSEDTWTGSFTAAIYGPDQDPFGEEDPLYGCWGTWDLTYGRIPVVPPC